MIKISKSRKKRTIVFSIFIIFIFSIAYYLLKSQIVVERKTLLLPGDIFFEEQRFFLAVNEINERELINNPIKAVVIPHHLVASELIADSMARMQLQRPKTLVLVAPNHYEKGDSNIILSDAAWSTPFGIVEPDVDLINAMLAQNIAVIDNTVVQNDHSINGLLPFIRYYLTDVNIVPIVFKYNTSEQEIDKLVQFCVQNITGQDIIYIASVDFSHYLMTEEANQKDKVSLQAMKDSDYERIASMNNDYLDSPASIITLLKIINSVSDDKLKMTVLGHSNSGEILGDVYQPTTSHYEIIWTH